MQKIHRAAAEGFEAGAEVYAAARPDYPEALEPWLTTKLKLGPGRRVLDLGAGTGKFLPRLLATGAETVAVEPVAAMRAALSARFPEIRALEGTAEAIPLEDNSVDAVTCAQCFHWFASAEALQEIRRVLKPGGVLGLIWNMRDESVPFVAAVQAVIAPYAKDAPSYGSGAWRRLFPADGFGPLEESRFSNVQSGPPEQVILGRLLSTSYIAALPEAERREVAARIEAVIAGDPTLAGKAVVQMPYETLAACCTKSG
ncbi:methyltransferase domain-containing protein [Methyloligella sp. 2.7D]|uniref:class I SAM-dependent methyltransferase n=1 Tax=unclassified Methyloligella TaxID=2625955 RepID=UPI00157C002A|nr:class I SAM-dependent methyltransferase [Methyloligella sp. GL2]QKP76337.1 methyltransferase domain-containing protein [Methyloligella sp. GL2]